MKRKLFILICIILICILFWQLNSNENFVEVNSYELPVKTMSFSPILDSQKELEKSLIKLSIEKNTDFDTSNYTLLNDNINFEYNDIIIKSILNILKTEYPKDKLYIQGKTYKIYESGPRDFILNVNLINPKSFLVSTLTVKIKNLEVIGLKLNLDTDTQLSYKGIDSLYNDYYQIKNKLHLMDPFLTSGKEMKVNGN